MMNGLNDLFCVARNGPEEWETSVVVKGVLPLQVRKLMLDELGGETDLDPADVRVPISSFIDRHFSDVCRIEHRDPNRGAHDRLLNSYLYFVLDEFEVSRIEDLSAIFIRASPHNLLQLLIQIVDRLLLRRHRVLGGRGCYGKEREDKK